MRRMISLVFGLIFLLVYLGAFNLESNDITIDSYIANITIDDVGDMRVVEEWHMEYHETMTVRFRDIVYQKYADGYPLYQDNDNTASIDQTDVVVKFFKEGIDRSTNISIGYSWNGDLDELGYPVVCEPNVPSCASIFVNTMLAGRMSGDVTFVYEYTIKGAITKYSDISELNWRLFTYAESKVDYAEINVNLPENTFTPSQLYVWGHGLYDGTIEIVANDRVEMTMSDIKDGDFPEFRILMENDLFPNIRQNNIVINQAINENVIMAYEADLADQYNLRVTMANILFYASFGIVAIMLGIGVLVYVKYDKEYVASFTGDYYRELPSEDTPATLSYLFFMEKIVDETITATLLDLIRKKHITLAYEGADMSASSSDFELLYNKEKSRENLTAHETYFLNYIFNQIGNGTKVTTKQIESYGSISESKAKAFQSFLKTFVKKAKQEAKSKKYFEVGLSNKRKIVLSANLIPLGFIAAALILSLAYHVRIVVPLLVSIAIMTLYAGYVYQIKKRSVKGNDLFAKWKAFKQFLISFGNMEDYPIPGIVVWEHYLVYATVLGVADQVTEQLQVRLPESELDDKEATFYTRAYHRQNRYHWGWHHRFNQSFTVARLNAQSKIVEARNARASAKGLGGGFGGGSSFGGGGGGGRSR